jgi:hypothetical protein
MDARVVDVGNIGSRQQNLLDSVALWATINFTSISSDTRA